MKKYPNINARAILRRHNRWLQGAVRPMEDLQTIGDAIDLICREHQEMEEALQFVAHNGLRAWQNQSAAMKCIEKIKRRKGIIK